MGFVRLQLHGISNIKALLVEKMNGELSYFFFFNKNLLSYFLCSTNHNLPHTFFKFSYKIIKVFKLKKKKKIKHPS